MAIDPYHKQLYQVNPKSRKPLVQARDLPTAEFPDKFDFDPVDQMVYWVDRIANVIKRIHLYQDKEEIIITLSKGNLFQLYMAGSQIHFMYAQF